MKGLVDRWLEGKDYFLTDLTVSDDDRIVVEIDHKDGVWIEDCVELSKYIEASLDREEADFELEVGSAGIGQPYKVLRQYENNVGAEVEVLTADGRKLTGLLKEVTPEGFVVTVKTKVKTDGAKRPKMVDVDNSFSFVDVKEVKSVIKF